MGGRVPLSSKIDAHVCVCMCINFPEEETGFSAGQKKPTLIRSGYYVITLLTLDT